MKKILCVLLAICTMFMVACGGGKGESNSNENSTPPTSSSESTEQQPSEDITKKVKVNVPSLPCTLNHYSLGDILTKTKVNSVNIEKTATDENTVRVSMQFSCTKTYDEYGEFKTYACEFLIVLYKENNVICESKEAFKNSVIVNQDFTIYYSFNADVSSGEREFTIKLLDN